MEAVAEVAAVVTRRCAAHLLSLFIIDVNECRRRRRAFIAGAQIAVLGASERDYADHSRRERRALVTQRCQKVAAKEKKREEGNLQPSASTNDINHKQQYDCHFVD